MTPLLNINYEGLHFYVPYDMPIIPVILSISHNDNVLVFGSYGNAEFHLYNKKDNSIYSFELFKENNFSCFSIMFRAWFCRIRIKLMLVKLCKRFPNFIISSEYILCLLLCCIIYEVFFVFLLVEIKVWSWISSKVS